MIAPNKLNLQKYFLLGEDGKERPFDAIDDSQANGLCQKRYSGQSWRLYRTTEGERVEVGSAERAQPGTTA